MDQEAPLPATPSRVITLVDHESTYWDGGEERVTLLLREAHDLSSTSHELSTLGRDWPEVYHLTKERANVVRALDLPATARVLEVGAGCGAVTRYLAEQCNQVDALEPVPARARAIDERTRDLDNITIYVGMLEDLPVDPVYDVVFVIGVLEHSASGAIETEPYEAFLREVATRLKPGGSLVLAIENRLGVKYIAGAVEDHTGRVYDSLEDYPSGSSARTFTRNELEGLVAHAGLEPRTFMAFPDYKLTRAVIASDEHLPSDLLSHLPRFPSPDWTTPRPRAIDEARMWETLVTAGVHAEFPNSFLVVARKPGSEAPQELWPIDRLATYFSTGRATQYSVRTEVVDVADTIVFRRSPLTAQPGPSGSNIAVTCTDDVFVRGTDLVRACAAPQRTDAERKDLLGQWRNALDQLREQAGSSSASCWDALPHNCIIEPTGELRFIDLEWSNGDATWDDIVARAALLTGIFLALQSSPELWPGCATVRDLVTHVGDLLEIPDAWINETVRREAEFQAEVAGRFTNDLERRAAVEHEQARLTAELDELLARTPLAPGRESTVRSLEHRVDELTSHIAHLHDAIDELNAQHQREIQTIWNSRSWKITKPLRGLKRLMGRG